MPVSPRLLAATVALCGALPLGGCSDDEAVSETVVEQDPALSAALDEPLMTDPDLVGQNRANSAASLPPQRGYLPTVDNGPERVSAARAEALELVGGPGKMADAPEAREVAGALPAEAALTAAARAAVAPGGDRNCATQVSYTMQWAALLPATFPVYPQGAVQEAAGTDTGGCALRVISFVTPVPIDDVIDFYFTRAKDAGYSAERVLQNGYDVLAGVKGGAAYVVYARRMPSGNTEIDLVVSG